jgi:uncharacterized protein (TIGR02996 family)
MTMNADAFLAEIVGNPDDDNVRLVFADWLEDQGDTDRAAFVRAQVRLAHFDWRAMPATVERFPGERGTLQRQVDGLWRRHKDEWLAELPQAVRRVVRFQRGFVEVLGGSPSHVLKVTRRFWATHPIRELDISNGPGDLADVLALPQLSRIRKLGLFRRLSREDCAALASTENLSAVRVLSDLGGNGDPAYVALARCPSLRGLIDAFLHAGLPNLTTEGFAAFTASDNVANLVALRLEMIHLKEDGARVVASSPRLAGLKILRICGRIGDAGARALHESPHLAGLESLELHAFDTISAEVREALLQRFGTALRIYGIPGSKRKT